MRMWKINPDLMCRKHLLGEHVEMHMFVECLNKGKSVRGYIDKGLVEIDKIILRHNELVEEMNKRGYNHNSPIYNIPICDGRNGSVDSDKNLIDIMNRCKDCKERYNNARIL